MGKKILSKADSEEGFDLISTWFNNCVEHHNAACNDIHYPQPLIVTLPAAIVPSSLVATGSIIESLRCKLKAAALKSSLATKQATAPPVGPSASLKVPVSHSKQLTGLRPERLIYVGNASGCNEVRLIETGRLKLKTVQYTTLSHCWGNSKPAITTKETLRERMISISVSALPKTFREAIEITRHLGIEYLWIDSLCIIQDCPEDWRTESSKMGKIYAHCSLTICAAGARDSHGGCFVERPAMPAIQVLSDVYVSEYIETIPFWSPEAVDTRAWCLQELALSPRVLMCGSRMMGWRCEEKTIIEQGQLPESPSKYGLRVNSKISTQNWNDVVANYSHRNLSQSRDKLIAISGLARKFANESTGQYLAGLWKRTLLTDLFWRVDIQVETSLPKISRPTSYRAPSWSWASLDGPVMFTRKTRFDWDNLASLVEANVVLGAEDPFGEVVGGLLRIRGPLALVTCRNTNSKVYPACFPLSSDSIQEEDSHNHCASCWFDLRDEMDWSKTSVFCLRITQTHGLVLLPVGDSGENFRRVGIANWVLGSWWKLDCPDIEISII